MKNSHLQAICLCLVAPGNPGHVGLKPALFGFVKPRLTRTGSVFLASAAVAAGVAVVVRRSRQGLNLRGKVVLITGGSRGLGLAMAREFAVEGCTLVLCARSQEELDTAKADLTRIAADVFTVVCDVSDQAQVNGLIEATIQKYGRVDVLVNNAAIIHVGPVDTMTIADFESAMDTIFWGNVYTTFAALPHLKAQSGARIVNITSVGGKVSVPHLIPYSCAKFATAAFSEGMRSVLQGTGVKVVTIAPGLMRTGSHLNALFKGDEAGEAAWFSLGASLPGISMSAERAATEIVCATKSGTAESILGTPANLLSAFHGLFPGVASDILGLVSRLLPHGSSRTERGADSAVLKKPVMLLLTALGRKAAERLLQPRRVLAS